MSDVDVAPESRERGGRGPRLTPLSLFIVLLVFYVVIEVRIVVLLILVAFLFSTIVDGPVVRLEGRGLPRVAAILVIYLAILAGIVGISLLVVPPITNEALAFWDQAPTLIDDLAEEWRTSGNPFLRTTGRRLLLQLKFRIENPPPPTGNTAIGLISNVGGAAFGIVAMFVISFYYLMEKRLFRNLALDLLAGENRDRMEVIWRDVEVKLGYWLRGQLLLMLIIGTFAGVFYYFIDMRFWLLLAVVAGITEAVPIVGPWIGGVPAVAIALVDSWEKAVIVAIFLAALQLLENTVLVPRVMKGTIGLSPLAVFIAVLAGGAFAGPLGALLALPVAAAIQVIITDMLRERNRDLALETGGAPTGPLAGWRSVLSQFLGDGGDRESRSDQGRDRSEGRIHGPKPPPSHGSASRPEDPGDGE